MEYSREMQLNGTLWATEAAWKVACGVTSFAASRWSDMEKVPTADALLEQLMAAEVNQASPFVVKYLSKREAKRSVPCAPSTSTGTQDKCKQSGASTKKRKRGVTAASGDQLREVASTLCPRLLRASLERTLYGDAERSLASELWRDWRDSVSVEGKTAYMPGFYRGFDGGGEVLAVTLPQLLQSVATEAARAKLALVATATLAQVRRCNWEKLTFMNAQTGMLDVAQLLEQLHEAKVCTAKGQRVIKHVHLHTASK